MKIRYSFIIGLISVLSYNVHAQIKIFEHGGIAIGSTTDDPGANIIKFYKSTIFDQSFTFNDNVTFDQTVTFNDGTNLFESYWGGSGGGLSIPGTEGTLSIYPSSNSYKFNTSEDFFIFEDKVQCADGLSVTSAGPSDFYSTTTFNSTVNVGQYGTMATANFYGNVVFQLANPSATFISNMPGEFSTGLKVYNYLTIYGSFNNYSDINLKTNIETLPKGSLGKVLSVQGVTYNFKTDVAEQTPRAGFIAQDIQKIFPDLVVEEKEGLAIKTLEIIPYMIEAIKEQQDLINQLLNRIEKLEAIK